VDVACARFGYPLYRHLRDHFGGDELRIWRASHFGGHVFAPTLIDLPSGHYWAYVTAAQAQQIVERSGDVRDLSGHLRGWAGLVSSQEQAADCALWQQEGWGWLDCARQGSVLDAPAAPADAPVAVPVRIDYTRPDGVQGAYRLRVEVTRTVATRLSTGDDEDYGYPQFAVTELHAVAPGAGIGRNGAE
jgi:hypothetical protein